MAKEKCQKVPFKCLRKRPRVKPRSGGDKFPMLNRKHKYSTEMLVKASLITV